MSHMWRIILTYRVLLYVGIMYVHPLHIGEITGFMTKKIINIP